MNCDDVFVILTRGPFPSGSQDDAAVERHLQACVECHRLAEALRPNDAALRDSSGEQEISALPGYWGDLVSAPTLSLKDTAGFRRPKRTARPRGAAVAPPKNLNVGQFAAAVALGIVFAAALRTLVTTAPAHAARQPLPENVNSAVLLAGLPDVCRGLATVYSASDPQMAVPLRQRTADASANCCTSCHAAGSDVKISDVNKLRIARTCSACH
jgi:hypothetical protein